MRRRVKLRLLLNEAMRIERPQVLEADPLPAVACEASGR
jgi:hypothetical protein